MTSAARPTKSIQERLPLLTGPLQAPPSNGALHSKDLGENGMKVCGRLSETNSRLQPGAACPQWFGCLCNVLGAVDKEDIDPITGEHGVGRTILMTHVTWRVIAKVYTAVVLWSICQWDAMLFQEARRVLLQNGSCRGLN